LRTWTLDKAYPVRWEVGALNSEDNKVAIETIELAHAGWKRGL
jgi:phage tail-like protein